MINSEQPAIDFSIAYRRHMKNLGVTPSDLVATVMSSCQFYLMEAHGMAVEFSLEDSPQVVFRIDATDFHSGPTLEEFMDSCRQIQLHVELSGAVVSVDIHTLADAYALQGLILFLY